MPSSLWVFWLAYAAPSSFPLVLSNIWECMFLAWVGPFFSSAGVVLEQHPWLLVGMVSLLCFPWDLLLIFMIFGFVSWLSYFYMMFLLWSSKLSFIFLSQILSWLVKFMLLVGFLYHIHLITFTSLHTSTYTLHSSPTFNLCYISSTSYNLHSPLYFTPITTLKSSEKCNFSLLFSTKSSTI